MPKAYGKKNWNDLAEYEQDDLLKVQYYTECIKKEPENDRAYYWRSLHLMRFGKYDQAIEDANKLIELDTYYKEGYVRKGHALLGKNLIDEAF